MLSQAQRALYWRTWSAICEQNGWDTKSKSKADMDDLRRALHSRAGLPHSMTQFANRHLNTFLLFAERLFGIARARDRDRENLLWRIRHDATAAHLDDAYIRKLSTDLTGLACYEELAVDDLTHLRNLIHTRARNRRSYTLDAAPRDFRGAHASPRVPAGGSPAEESNPF